MTKPATIALQVLSAFMLLAGGYWLGKLHTEQIESRNFVMLTNFEIRERIQTLNSLYNGDSSAAIQRLERWLDRDAIALGPNEYHPRSLKSDEKSALLLIANHRNAHPFSQPTHPGINDMVQKALKAAQ